MTLEQFRDYVQALKDANPSAIMGWECARWDGYIGPLGAGQQYEGDASKVYILDDDDGRKLVFSRKWVHSLKAQQSVEWVH